MSNVKLSEKIWSSNLYGSRNIFFIEEVLCWGHLQYFWHQSCLFGQPDHTYAPKYAGKSPTNLK